MRLDVTTTNFVLAAVKAALSHQVDASALAEFDDVTEPSGRRVTMGLRMPPSLYEKLQRTAGKFGVSVNRYISFVVHRAIP